MMSLRSRIFVLLSLIIFVILAISIGLLVLRDKPEGEVPNDKAPAGTNEPVVGGSVSAENVPNTPLPIQTNPLEVEQNGVKQLARVFVERYNTYSTENDYANIREVEELVTPALWTRISARLSTPPAGPFIGVTTRAVGATLGAWEDAAATVTVKAYRATTKDGATTNTNQDVTVYFVKTGDAWLVDKFETK